MVTRTCETRRGVEMEIDSRRETISDRLDPFWTGSADNQVPTESRAILVAGQGRRQVPARGLASDRSLPTSERPGGLSQDESCDSSCLGMQSHGSLNFVTCPGAASWFSRAFDLPRSRQAAASPYRSGRTELARLRQPIKTNMAGTGRSHAMNGSRSTGRPSTLSAWRGALGREARRPAARELTMWPVSGS